MNRGSGATTGQKYGVLLPKWVEVNVMHSGFHLRSLGLNSTLNGGI